MSGRAAVPRALHALARSFAPLAEFALPQRCPACGELADTRVLCDACWNATPRAGLELCVRCLAHERDPSSCSAHRAFRVRAAWLYDERAAAVVAAFKYAERPGLARALGPELAAVVRGAAVDVVTEVPLHPARRRERGFNQAERLAAALSTEIGALHVPGVLRRVRATLPQARLGPRERRAQARGSVLVARPEGVRGRRILVVDDVMTTGATLEACLAALDTAGARPSGAALAWAQ